MIIIGQQRQLGPVWDFSPLCPRSFLPDFLLLFYFQSGVCSFLLFHHCYSHARGILCDTPRAWDPRSLQSMLNDPLYFETKGLNCRSIAIDRPFGRLQNKINNLYLFIAFQVLDIFPSLFINENLCLFISASNEKLGRAYDDFRSLQLVWQPVEVLLKCLLEHLRTFIPINYCVALSRCIFS